MGGEDIERTVTIQPKTIIIEQAILDAAQNEVEEPIPEPEAEAHQEEFKFVVRSGDEFDVNLHNISTENFREKYANISGEDLVKEVCEIIDITGNPVNSIIGQLTDQIENFNQNKSIANIEALYSAFADLSGQSIGYTHIPVFTLNIPHDLKSLAGQERAGAERISEEQRLAQQNIENNNRQQQLRAFQGDNRVQVIYYIKAYNFCVQNHQMNQEGFTNALNNRAFAVEGEEPQVEQITQEQGITLFNALRRLGNSQNIGVNSAVYKRLTENEQVLNAGDPENLITDIQVRVNAIAVVAGINIVNPVPCIENQINNIDDIFTSFNENKENFKEVIKSKLTPGLNEEQKTESANKLYSVLEYFGNKNPDGEITQEQQDMLKNNSVFMNFIGWICSLIPEFMQVSFIENFAKRYELSKALEQVNFVPVL